MYVRMTLQILGALARGDNLFFEKASAKKQLTLGCVGRRVKVCVCKAKGWPRVILQPNSDDSAIIGRRRRNCSKAIKMLSTSFCISKELVQCIRSFPGITAILIILLSLLIAVSLSLIYFM